MAKKAPKKKKKGEDLQIPGLENLPPEAKKKLREIKKKLDTFKDQVLGKFEDYILGVALLPPPKPQPGKELTKEELDKIGVLVLVDDSDSKKMSKLELKDKLTAICDEMAKKIDKNIIPSVILISEFWQSCYDGKYDLMQLIAMSAPVYNTGMLSAIKIGEIHKSMILKKFERYIVSYVLFGSLTRGEATPESDIDVAIIIDDTDVKKMTRAELKDKLRAIIIGMGIEAGQMTGIKNKLNIQVYILTEFWDSIKEANPVIFTVLRDGVPFYDRGMFMPWKQLLRMGRIKPSQEAIDMFMSTGEQMVGRVTDRLLGIIEADIYWATLTPTQAALMLYGIPPPTPNETINLMKEIFVDKLKLLEPKYVEIMQEIRRYYKGIEHGTIKKVSGKEVDDLLAKADEYLKRIKKLFQDIELLKEKESILHIYETMVTTIRDVLKLEGIEKVSDVEIVRTFEDELIAKGKIPAKHLRLLNELLKAKENYDKSKLTRTEVEKVRKSSRELLKFLVEYMQRKRGLELERAKIRVKHGNRYGEVLLLDKEAFIIHDIDHEEKEISKATIKSNGGLGTIKTSSLEELEKALAKVKIPKRVFIKSQIFEDLGRVFGKDVEVLVNRV